MKKMPINFLVQSKQIEIDFLIRVIIYRNIGRGRGRNILLNEFIKKKKLTVFLHVNARLFSQEWSSSF